MGGERIARPFTAALTEVGASHAGSNVQAHAGSSHAGLRGPVLGAWLPAPLPTPRALPDHGALWPLAVGVEKDLGGIDV